MNYWYHTLTHSIIFEGTAFIENAPTEEHRIVIWKDRLQRTFDASVSDINSFDSILFWFVAKEHGDGGGGGAQALQVPRLCSSGSSSLAPRLNSGETFVGVENTSLLSTGSILVNPPNPILSNNITLQTQLFRPGV